MCNIVFIDPEFCEAQSVGLVRYPATLAPDSGSTTVTAQCADNASPTTSLSVTCHSDGRWSGSPQCQCHTGYEAATVNGRLICQGIMGYCHLPQRAMLCFLVHS